MPRPSPRLWIWSASSLVGRDTRLEHGRGAPAPLDLALDQNFPEPILDALARFVDIRLIPLRRIDPRLPSLEDRELLIALHQLRYRGLVTNNCKMLKNPRELAAVIATRFAAFAIEGVGHDPLRATGALLLDLPGAARRMHEVPGRVFCLRPASLLHKRPGNYSKHSPSGGGKVRTSCTAKSRSPARSSLGASSTDRLIRLGHAL